MATTTLLKIKSNNTKTLSHILKDRTEYIENDKKTNSKELVSAFMCVPESAHLDFTASKYLYEKLNTRGYETKKNDDVLAYHIRQAFSPDDNITPEQAHEIGKKLADEFTKGNHEYVIATHIDKKHIHNHIIFNSTTIDCTRKFNNFYNSTYAVRKISDRLCEENNLSVVASKNEKGKHYKEWLEDNKGNSWKSKLKINIDKCIDSSTNFEEFLKAMQDTGYEIKQGKHIAFKATGQERFTRAKTLGEMYIEENIKRRISEKAIKIESKPIENNKKKRNIVIGDIKKVSRLPVTLDKRVMITARKQQIANVKDLANTLMLLRRESINSKSDFDIKINELRSQAAEIKESIMKIDSKVIAYRDISKYLATVNKQKDIYAQYQKCNMFNKKSFYSKHEGDILSYEHAARKLSELNINIETPLDKVVAMTKDYTVKTDTLKKDFNAIDNRLKEIRAAKEKVIEVLNNKKDIDHKKSREQEL